MKKIISTEFERQSAMEMLANVDIKKRPYIFELYKQIIKRTVKQNAYFHVCVRLFAIEIGLTEAEAKTDLKRECPFMRYEKKGKFYLKETKKQTTKELTDFIEWIRNFSAKQGIYIPTANEYDLRRDDFDNIIEYNKQYL